MASVFMVRLVFVVLVIRAGKEWFPVFRKKQYRKFVSLSIKPTFIMFL